MTTRSARPRWSLPRACSTVTGNAIPQRFPTWSGLPASGWSSPQAVRPALPRRGPRGGRRGSGGCRVRSGIRYTYLIMLTTTTPCGRHTRHDEGDEALAFAAGGAAGSASAGPRSMQRRQQRDPRPTRHAPRKTGPRPFPSRSRAQPTARRRSRRQPKRIVTVGLTEQDALLALGIVPVGTTVVRRPAGRDLAVGDGRAGRARRSAGGRR